MLSAICEHCKSSSWRTLCTLSPRIQTYFHCFLSGDDNAGRREVVRRKTARYLMKAEDIYNRHLVGAKGPAADDNRWDVSYCRPALTHCLDYMPISALRLRTRHTTGKITHFTDRTCLSQRPYIRETMQSALNL